MAGLFRLIGFIETALNGLTIIRLARCTKVIFKTKQDCPQPVYKNFYEKIRKNFFLSCFRIIRFNNRIPSWFLDKLLLPRKLIFEGSTLMIDFFQIPSWSMTKDIPAEKFKGALIVKNTLGEAVVVFFIYFVFYFLFLFVVGLFYCVC